MHDRRCDLAARSASARDCRRRRDGAVVGAISASQRGSADPCGDVRPIRSLPEEDLDGEALAASARSWRARRWRRSRQRQRPIWELAVAIARGAAGYQASCAAERAASSASAATATSRERSAQLPADGCSVADASHRSSAEAHWRGEGPTKAGFGTGDSPVARPGQPRPEVERHASRTTRSRSQLRRTAIRRLDRLATGACRSVAAAVSGRTVTLRAGIRSACRTVPYVARGDDGHRLGSSGQRISIAERFVSPAARGLSDGARRLRSSRRGSGLSARHRLRVRPKGRVWAHPEPRRSASTPNESCRLISRSSRQREARRGLAAAGPRMRAVSRRCGRRPRACSACPSASRAPSSRGTPGTRGPSGWPRR